MAAQGHGKFGPGADPGIPPNKKGHLRCQKNVRVLTCRVVLQDLNPWPLAL